MSGERALAARALAPVLLADATLDESLKRLPATLEGRERALVRELCYGVCRWYPELAGLLAPLLTRRLKAKDSDVHALLLLGIYQMRHLRTPDHAAVGETVAACAALQKAWARGFVNAVLRAYQSRSLALEAGLERAATLAHPPWLLAAIERSWPESAAAIVAANNAPGPLALRVNASRSGRDAWIERARAAGIACRASDISSDGVVLDRAVEVGQLPGFAAGEVSVQDEAAQLAAPLLDARAGERVLDACAAPGGKACHVLERTPGVDLLALDANASRLVRVEENLSRLGLRARVQAGDATEPATWWDGTPFDRILVDAPCSGTGVIRRHPDIKLLRTPAQVRDAVALQQRMLRALWPMLRPGGHLLYATCSVLPEENEGIVAAFLAQTPDAEALAPGIAAGQPSGCGRQLLPGSGSHDGFFYALLRRRAG